MRKVIFNEDFKDFQIGEFPYDRDYTALGEYHYLMPKGYRGNWYDPISIYTWRGMGGTWLITGDKEKKYLEQNRGNVFASHFADLSAVLVLREKVYAGYHMTFDIRLFDLENASGVVFNYISSKKYYAFYFENNEIILSKRDQKENTIISKKEFIADDLKTYNVRVELENDCKVFIDDILMFEENIEFIPSKLGVIGRGAARYSDIIVTMDELQYEKHMSKVIEYKEILNNKRKKYSQLECIKKIDLSNFGSGRQFRIGQKQNGEIFFILAQHQKRMYRDSFAHLSCMTAFDLNGNVMWQIGEPNNSDENTVISCDLPMQVSDINNDGRLEVIYAMNFEVLIIDAETGEFIRKMNTPCMKEYDSKYPYNRLNVDAIRVADFEGLGYQGDFIIKDRYSNVFAYDKDMNLMWRYNHKNTGHFPYIYDFDGDGKDEMYVGYDMVDSDGEIKWSLPINSDHTDEIIYLKTHVNNPERLYLASGNEGFNIANMDGSLYKSINVGHAQRISIADYNKNTEGLDICVTSFWGANDIIYMFDCNGNLMCEKEMMENGNIITPVNLDGENTLILATAKAGLMDSDLDIVVEFPDDGHPTLCSEVLDIDDDGVDEIICWDQNKMYIYKAKEYKSGNKYLKYPDNAFSNYRGEFIVKKGE